MYYEVKKFFVTKLQRYLTNTDCKNIILVDDKCAYKNDNDASIQNLQTSQQDSDLIYLDIPLEYPRDKTHGHFATPIAFVLAKILHKNPKNIAQDIAIFLQHNNTYSIEDIRCNKNAIYNNLDSHLLKMNTTLESKIFDTIEAVNGYLNVTLSDLFLAKQVDIVLQNSEYFAKGNPKDHAILLEYVSANPTGPLHIGHARGAIFGSVLQSIGIRLGYSITSEYYINDAGSQIDMLALSVYNKIALKNGLEYSESETYKGEYIDDIAQKAVNFFGISFFKEKKMTDILQQLGVYAKDLMLEEIQHNLKALNIEFDSFVSEKTLYKHWDKTLRQLESHNALVYKDGAIWLQSQEKGDEKNRVLVRDNGEPTYMAGDILYHAYKFQRHYDSYINIWGADHHGYIARIKASIEFLGFDSDRLEVLLAQMVSLLRGGQPYKMSKRAGNFILLQDVINEIGADSLKFVFLSKSLDTHLEFDLEDLNKEDSSNPVFYINYANARIHTLIEKSQFTIEQIQAISLYEVFTQCGYLQNDIKADCLELALQSLGLLHVLYQSYNERQLQKLCEYLRNLAKLLHTFYNTHKILNTSHEIAILKILLLVSLSLEIGFKMLGITIKIKM